MSTIAFGTSVVVPHSHLRITRRGRAVLTLLIAVPLAIAAAVTGIGSLAAAAGTEGSTATFQYVTVEPGESLWQVAESVAPTADPRDVIADIESLNNLGSGEVQAGQRLAIPTKYDN
ncbi:MAG TPA: LysM peptidoglycan-binding domain-containing protein [Pseudolysinimonas sp.]